MNASRAFAFALVGVLGACGSESAAELPALAPVDGPDIVLVSIDSLRADHLSCYGYERPTSPFIDRLAREGVRFENAVSTTSWTLPSHAALFTGLYDSAHGLVDNGLRLGDEHVTLAEVLAAAGYRTAGFFGGPYLHPTFGLAQGFASYESCMTTIPEQLDGDAIRDESRAPHGAAHADVTGPRTLERVTDWLKENVDGSRDERPFFLFVHLWDVHYDFIPPAEYVEMFDPDYEGAMTGVDFASDPAIRADMAPRDLEHLIARYDGEIRFTDDILGRIFAEIEERGRETLFVVTADHGEEFFEHGRKGHQKSLFEEVVRIPLVVHWPGTLDGGRAVEEQVRLIDVFPTLLAFLGVGIELELQGRDVGPLLRGEPLAPEPALCELLVDGRKLRAVRTNDHKILATGPGESALFDLRSDPNEQVPLEASPDELRAQLALLRKLRKEAISFGARLGERTVRATELDPELRSRLSGLGYLGDDEEPTEEGSSEQ